MDFYDIENHILNDGRRFFFVVEAAFPVRGGTVLRGVIHGKVDLDDEVFILQPSKPMLKTKVKGMEAEIESHMMKIQTATDMTVHLFMAINPADIERYAVVTSVMPMLQPEESGIIENPALSALLFEKRFFADEGYFDLLCFSLVHARYVTMVQMEQEAENTGKTPIPYDKEARTAFCMVNDPKNKKMKLLPVFTDEAELSKCEQLIKNEKARTVVLSFADIVSITKPMVCSGFVLNPCSDNQSVIGKPVIWGITESEGYKKEFDIE